MKKRPWGLALIATLLVFTAVSAYATTKTTTINVKGMHCKMCSASVTKALKAVDGVEKVDVSFERGTATVAYDDQKVTEERLREVINSTGFKVVDEKTE